MRDLGHQAGGFEVLLPRQEGRWHRWRCRRVTLLGPLNVKLLHYAFRHRGVTLVEMLVGVAVLGVLLAAAIPSMSSMIERRRVVAAAGEIANIFSQARSESTSLSNKVNIHLEPVPAAIGDFSCVRLSTKPDAIDVCRCNRAAARVCSAGTGKLLREYLLPRDSSVTFAATGSWGAEQYVVTFSRGGFSDSDNVQVLVTGTRTQAKLRVDYIRSGRVRTCSPDGSIGGFPVCPGEVAS
ncbi:MAG: prepilin-type N-terminal cleavage/methylation domain-containing protein [Oxalobacteraceae bacterium]|nr:MAG: prepilin-type N-terminal cleavage/methylation domain-containing protein [Oxalobacteraceae bacterium]